MKKVKMQLDKGRFVTVEVEDDTASKIEEMNREIWRTVKREARHESLYSLDALAETNGLEIADDSPSAEERLIEEESRLERTKRLHNAIAKLTPRQREMLKMVYFEGRSQDEVATVLCVTKSAISNAMQRIYSALKKYLEEN